MGMNANGKRRVVITGGGLVTPVGNDVATAWPALLAGKSGGGPITRYEPTDEFTVRIACEGRDAAGELCQVWQAVRLFVQRSESFRGQYERVVRLENRLENLHRAGQVIAFRRAQVGDAQAQ